MADEADKKRLKHRSPAYPSLPLQTAIDKAKLIYQSERRSAAPVAVVVQHCGMDIKNSSGLRLIAALKQYGLLIEEGSKEDREVRLSDRALDILFAESDDSSKRISAIKAAALAPPIHKKIWEKYNGEIPSTANLKSYLLRELDFNDAHVDRFIKTFLATIGFAKVAEPDTMDDEDDIPEEEGNDMEEVLERPRCQHAPPDIKKPSAPPPGTKDFPLYTSTQRGALYVPAMMSQSDFGLLKQQIDAYLKVIEATSIQPPDPQDS
jgi:hypothetical protein